MEVETWLRLGLGEWCMACLEIVAGDGAVRHATATHTTPKQVKGCLWLTNNCACEVNFHFLKMLATKVRNARMDSGMPGLLNVVSGNRHLKQCKKGIFLI